MWIFLDSILLKSIPSHSNGRFSEEALIQDNNTSLANDYGNLIMRTVKLAIKRGGNEYAYSDKIKIENDFSALKKTVQEHIEKFEHDKALKEIWHSLQGVNAYINQKEPWSIKEMNDELNEIFFNCLYSIHCLTYMISPAMPETAVKILQVLGYDLSVDPTTSLEGIKYHLSTPEVPFKKIQ
jgi:methionyl-tRNA synthetase